eukprot:3383810-Amphidinium_carterae.2
MLLAQSEAAKLAMESIPSTAAAQQVIAPNGQVMIALVTQGEVPPPIDPRWHTPSAVISRQKCWFCGEEDQPDRPLQICWHENQATGVKCGKRFCFNNHKKCGSRVAFNIKAR